MKTSQLSHVLGSRGWERFSLCWEFLVPDSHLLGVACHNHLNGFLRNYSCKGKKMHLSLSLQESNQKMVTSIMINELLCINNHWHTMGFWESYHMSSLLLFLCLSDLFSWTLRTQVRLLELAGRKISIFYPT